MDPWSLAPAVASVRTFAEYGVTVSISEARQRMGLRTLEHLQAILYTPDVSEKWKQAHGRLPGDADALRLARAFVPNQMACLRMYSSLVPGMDKSIHSLRNEFSVQIGSASELTRKALDVLLEASKRQGFVPDCSVASDEVKHPCPWPSKIYKNMDIMSIQGVGTVAHVGATAMAISTGRNAGAWTIGVAATSPYTDIESVDHARSMCPVEYASRVDRSRAILYAAGAHFVVEDITHLHSTLSVINSYLSKGVMPSGFRSFL